MSKLPELKTAASGRRLWLVFPEPLPKLQADLIRRTYPEFGVSVGLSDTVLAWNLTFYPRVYATDASGRLAFIQRPEQSFGQAVLEGDQKLKEVERHD